MRPPTVCKLLTTCITNKIYIHCESNNIVSVEQRCVRNAQGCKEQILINSVILEKTIHKQRVLHTAYNDYRNEFGSYSTISSLQYLGYINKIIILLEYLMSIWRIQLHRAYIGGTITVRT